MLFDEIIIFDLPLRFIGLRNAESCDNNIYITIPFELFYDKLIMRNYLNTIIKFKIINTSSL